MAFLDLHSHILPGVDDGSQSVEESIEILKELKKQGVTHVIATPHFDAVKEDADDFEEARARAYNELTYAIRDLDLPKVILGCEVLYFPGMSKASSIDRFKIADSNYILIEFGIGKYGPDVINDIITLSNTVGLTPIIAHIERYVERRNYKDLVKLVKSGIVLAQVNAASVAGKTRTKLFNKEAMRLIKHGLITFIGSDAHSMAHRPPEFTEAFVQLEKKFGKAAVNYFKANSQQLLSDILQEDDDDGELSYI